MRLHCNKLWWEKFLWVIHLPGLKSTCEEHGEKGMHYLQMSDGARGTTQLFVTTRRKHKAELNALKRGPSTGVWTTHTKAKGEASDSGSWEIWRDLGLAQNQVPGCVGLWTVRIPTWIWAKQLKPFSDKGIYFAHHIKSCSPDLASKKTVLLQSIFLWS